MRLRNRVIVWGALTMIVVGVLLLALIWQQMLGSVERVERAELTHEISHANTVLGERTTALADLATRWAAEGGRVAHAEGLELWNPAIILSGDGTEPACDLLVLCAADGTGLRVLGRGGPAGTELRDAAVPGILAAYPQFAAAGSGGAVSGLAELPDGRLALVATRGLAVPTSEVPRVLVLAVKLIDAPLEMGISRATDLDVNVESLASRPDSEVREGVRVWPASDDRFAAEVVLEDVAGLPKAVLAVETGRTMRAEAVKTLRFITVGVFGLIAIAALGLGFALDRMVLGRLARLSTQVDRVAKGASEGPVVIEGRDEISSLAQHIDTTVAALASSRDELSCAHSALEERVEERTMELRAAVANLREEIAERRRTEEALFESEQRFRRLVDSLFDAVITVDESGRVLFANAAVASVFGQQPASVVGSSVAELFDEASAAELGERLGRGIDTPVHDLILKTRDVGGSSHDVELTLSPSHGPLGVVQGIVRDVTMRQRYESELVHMASHDFLTGLSNRRRFEEEVERAVAQALRRESPGAILWFDLDYFKEVNDTLGHRAGDELLVRVAETLSRTVRSESLLARLGGDEFALLLYQADAVEARHAAERVLSEIKNLPFSVGGNVVRTSASLGVVLFPEHGTEVEELLTRADVAMYRAKEMGRSRWVIYSSDEDWRDDMHHRRSWADRIQRALDEGHLVAYAQPVVGVADGTVRSFELLVRLRERDGSLIEPDAFLSAAERVGLVRDVDLWMVREAIALLGTYQSEQLQLEVNLSSRTFADPSFFIEVGEMLRRAAVAPARLGIEVTEQAVMSDTSRIQDSLRIIDQIGCRLSLDHFGSGFSAFYHLKHLPLDELKIDGDFIGRLSEGTADQHLVRAIVETARGMGMRTTAEFVETTGILELLKEYGVDRAQGFGIAEPGPAVDVIERALRSSPVTTDRISAAS